MDTTTAPSSAAPISRTGGRVTIIGDLGSHNRQLLKQEVLDALAAGEQSIVVDATQSDYIDSSGLGVLVSCSRRCREDGATFAVAGLNEAMRTLFAQTRLDTVLAVVEPRP
jgi:anti-sigma B factor antagonist